MKQEMIKFINKGLEKAGIEKIDGSFDISSAKKGKTVLDMLKTGKMDKNSRSIKLFCEALASWYGYYIIDAYNGKWIEDFRGQPIVALENHWVIDPIDEVFDYVYGPSDNLMILERLESKKAC